MKKNYYYRCGVDTPIGKALTAFMEQCSAADQAAQAWAAEHGAKEYLESPLGMAGGVAMLIAPLYNKRGMPQIVDEKLWKSIEVNGVGLCYEPAVADDFDPKEAAQRTDLTKAEQLELSRIQLPVVTESQLVALLQPKPVKLSDGRFAPTVMTVTPLLFRKADRWHIKVPFECQAKGLKRTRITSVG